MRKTFVIVTTQGQAGRRMSMIAIDPFPVHDSATTEVIGEVPDRGQVRRMARFRDRAVQFRAKPWRWTLLSDA
jgi:hypothetical protein